jgi:hypothetical protein
MPGTELDYFTHVQPLDWEEKYDDQTGMPHYPATNYYLSESNTLIDPEAKLFEFIVPLYPIGLTSRVRVDEWIEVLSSGEEPVVLAASVIDYKTPTMYDDRDRPGHCCLTHYVLDGHHRLLAAAQVQAPIRLLSFLSISESCLKDKYIEQAILALPRYPEQQA